MVMEMFSKTSAHAVQSDGVDARIDVSQTETDNLINEKKLLNKE